MAMRERQSRGITQKRAWCSLWHLAVDPIEKACYKWKKGKPKGNRKFSLSLFSPKTLNVESQNPL
jgi:hypothetical protein